MFICERFENFFLEKIYLYFPFKQGWIKCLKILQYNQQIQQKYAENGSENFKKFIFIFIVFFQDRLNFCTIKVILLLFYIKKYSIILKEVIIMLSLELFVNDKYKLFKFLYDNQIQVKENYYVTLSQQEIADILHFSKLKTNNIIKELRKNNFIDTYNNKRGKYIITGKGCKVIEIIKKNT